MSESQKLLFVCSQNVQRSLTAERLLDGVGGYEARSAGTEKTARRRLKGDLIEWADIVFVMESRHLQALRKDFKRALQGKRLICLQIPDGYGFMNARLVELLKEKLSLYIALPRSNQFPPKASRGPVKPATPQT